MITFLWVLAIIFVWVALAYNRASVIVWTIAGILGLVLVSKFSHFSWVTLSILWLLFLIPAVFINVYPLRKKFIKSLFRFYKNVMPTMSVTEKEAIAVGTVHWGGEIFKGDPDWKGMLAQPSVKLTEEEQAFLDGPVEELCKMVDDWDITHNRCDLPPEVWQFIKDKGFFGMIIPKQYGGLEFSASAHSAVILKVASTGVTAATSVGVPNSLGPGELILKYGTEDQKNYYLPRLAKGAEIPCFALTGPEAGSDAGAIPDSGIVCKGMFEGKKIIGIKLNFNKRYITLAPIATVIGLAFKMYDPDHLMGKKDYIGITCVLLPRDTPGIEIGRRHFPLNSAFQNGPIHGKDVFIPLSWIIGGEEMAGKGWKMLVECLSVGRGITLPSISAAGGKFFALSSGAYSRIRKQFGLPIGYFEGIEEALARIAGNAYLIDALREMTVAALDRDELPAVLTAISKYHTTERARAVSMDAMDIHGGKGICLGPNNYLGRNYESIPISITVEGANILTRSMIIFGQGAIRCHPYILNEINAANFQDKERGLRAFDKAIIGHAGFIISNFVRSLLLGLTNAYIVVPPRKKGRRYYQQLTRFSSAFALLADMSMLVFGGELKRKEKISARLGDVLSMLYAGSAVLKRFYDQGEMGDDLPLLDWTCQDILYVIQNSIDGVLRNFPNRFVATLLRLVIFPLGRCMRPPSDKLGHILARMLLEPNDTRTRLGQGIYNNIAGPSPMGKMEETLRRVVELAPLDRKMTHARKEKIITGLTAEERVQSAIEKGIITQEEAKQLLELRQARLDIINVDDFDSSELARTKA